MTKFSSNLVHEPLVDIICTIEAYIAELLLLIQYCSKDKNLNNISFHFLNLLVGWHSKTVLVMKLDFLSDMYHIKF